MLTLMGSFGMRADRVSLPRWMPGRGVQVIDGEVPPGVVPPSMSMNIKGKDQPPPPPPPDGGSRCTCNKCPTCGKSR